MGIFGVRGPGERVHAMWLELERADKMQRLVKGIGPEPINATLVDGDKVKPVEEMAASSKRVRCS